METQDPEVSAESLKEQGNKAVKENNFKEAVLYYTQAIKLDPQNHTLYSNRSLAYLKLKHYNLAISDAEETILLNPSWPKGYFRKGEVEFATENYSEAYESYREAFRCKPDDTTILQALNEAAKGDLRQRKYQKEVPWVGAGIGIIIGVTILVADFLTTQRPTSPLLMAIITIIIAIIGYGIAKAIMSHRKEQRCSLLRPSRDLEEDMKEEEKETKRHPRYTKSQARMRYKKGKA